MITKLVLDDYSEISDIYNAIFPNKWSASSFMSMLEADNYFGYKFVYNQSISGFILCSAVIDEIEIITFCVKTECRKQGIGTQLLSTLDKHANTKKATIFLEVSKENPIAIKLYTNLGYKQFSVRKKYYDGIDAIMMRKETGVVA